jgi:hypothetical protein
MAPPPGFVPPPPGFGAPPPYGQPGYPPAGGPPAKSGIPGWAWAIIAVIVGFTALSIISIIAVTLLGSSASSTFETVGPSIDGDRGPMLQGDEYGDNPTLDRLWDACAAGDGAACDDLYFRSPFGSEYEDFGNTCGGRYESYAGITYCEGNMD